tara:strand:- start:452 stop:580 length:129 start_codon:yes stop_codon:yes gene_type:complete
MKKSKITIEVEDINNAISLYNAIRALKDEYKITKLEIQQNIN